MDRDIRESLRQGEPRRAAAHLLRAGRYGEALRLLARLWSEGGPDREELSERLQEAFRAVPCARRVEHAALLEDLDGAGFPGAESLFRVWLPPVTRLVGRSLPMRRLRTFVYAQARAQVPVAFWGENGVEHDQAALALHELGDRASFHEVYARMNERRLLAALERETQVGGTVFLSYSREEGPAPAVQAACARRGLRMVLGVTSPREPRGSLPACRIAPLRERRDDLPLLLETYLRAADASAAVAGVDAQVLHVLNFHDWPGNTRELRNRVATAVLNARVPQDVPRQLMEGFFGLPGEVAQGIA